MRYDYKTGDEVEFRDSTSLNGINRGIIRSSVSGLTHCRCRIEKEDREEISVPVIDLLEIFPPGTVNIRDLYMIVFLVGDSDVPPSVETRLIVARDHITAQRFAERFIEDQNAFGDWNYKIGTVELIDIARETTHEPGRLPKAWKVELRRA